MSLRLKVVIGFVVICLIWGSSWAAVKIGIESIPPLLSLGIRFTLSSILLGLIFFFKHLQIPRQKKFWKLVLIICLTSFTIPFVLIYWAQLKVGSGLSSVLFATFPFWVAIVSHFLLQNEKYTPIRMIGIVIGFLGVIIIFNDGLSEVNITIFYRMAALIIGAIIQSFGLVFLRRFGEDAHPVTLNFISISLSTLPLFAASLVFENYSNITFNAQAIASILYLSIFCTVITFVIYFWLVKHVEAVILSLSAFITPIIAVLIGVIVMGENITNSVYIGSALVLIGVAFASIGYFFSPYKREAKEEYL